jgi:hypothetical protein
MWISYCLWTIICLSLVYKKTGFAPHECSNICYVKEGVHVFMNWTELVYRDCNLFSLLATNYTFAVCVWPALSRKCF